MIRIILTFLFIVSCVLIEEDTQGISEADSIDTIKVKENKIGKCKYRYFLNDKQEPDSAVIECPDPRPPGSPNDE